MCLFIMISFDILELDNLYIPIMSETQNACSFCWWLSSF